MVVFNGTPFKLAEEPFATTGVPSLMSEDGAGNIVRSPNRSFVTRAELAASKIMAGVTSVTVELYAAGGPIVNMSYSINNTTQASTDPTSMAVIVVAANGTTSTKYTKLASYRVTPAMMGAPINGTDDDAFAIQRAVTYYGNCYADYKGVDYQIKSNIKMRSGSMIDLKGALLHVDVVNYFTNASAATNMNDGIYSDSACVIQVCGSRVTTASPIHDVEVLNCNLVPTVVTDVNGGPGKRNLTPILMINCGTNVRIAGNEMSGFNCGVGVNYVTLLGPNVIIEDNYIHDWYSNYTWSSSTMAQASGIAGDGDRIDNATSSRSVIIRNNTIVRLTKGATAIAANGYQTDGINTGVTASGNVPISGFTYQIYGNSISEVDEAIDNFASWCHIHSNRISNVNVAFKHIYLASDCLIENNHCTKIKAWSVCLISSVGEVARNVFKGNVFKYVGGYSTISNLGLWIGDDGTSRTRDNLFEGNTWEFASGTPDTYVIMNTMTSAGSSNNVSHGDKWVGTGVMGFIDTENGKFLIEAPVTPSRVLLGLVTDFVKSTSTVEVLPLRNPRQDTRAEYIGSPTFAPILVLPGLYEGKVVLGSSTWPINNLITISVLSNDPVLGLRTMATGYFTTGYAGATLTLPFDNVAFRTKSTVTVSIEFASTPGSPVTILHDNNYSYFSISMV